MSPCPCCGFNPATRKADDIGKMLIMGRAERRVFDVFAKNFGRVLVTEAVISAVYFDDPNGGPQNARKCIDVFVCRLNKKLKAYDLQIKGALGSNSGRRMLWIGGDA